MCTTVKRAASIQMAALSSSCAICISSIRPVDQMGESSFETAAHAALQ